MRLLDAHFSKYGSTTFWRFPFFKIQQSRDTG